MRTRRLTLLIPLAIAVGLLVATTGSAFSGPVTASVSAAEEPDTEVVLPSRVANAIGRTDVALDAASVALDSGNVAGTTTLLAATRLDVFRVDRAARSQMNAAPPAEDPEAETGDEPVTTGPDSVIAALSLDQAVATRVAGLFDTKKGATLDSLTSVLFAALNTRDKLLTAVLALDPEGAGADYADGMADTVAGYDDEVANLTEALASDTLSAGGKKVLTAALNQSKATQAKVAAGFGGGE
jgi:hypothetical protein